MDLSLISGSANPRLAQAVADALGRTLACARVERFPDGEQHVQIMESVRGRDVYVLQPASPPVDEHLIQLLLLCDASRRAGAARITAVVPYFGYARQDRRARGREAVAARLVADLIEAAGCDRVVAVDLHTSAIEGFFRIGVEHLSAVPVLAGAARRWLTHDAVVVAPDLGASRLAERYAALLGLPMAIVRKTRVSGEQVRVAGITGEVRGLAPVIVDDMISTGATVVAAVESLTQAGCKPEIVVVATHALLAGPAAERLYGLSLRRLIVTDSVHVQDDLPLPLETVSVAPLLADAIGRLHRHEPLGDLIAHE